MNDILFLDQNAFYKLRSGARNIRTSKFSFDTVSTIGQDLWGNLANDKRIQIV